jgi:hypothetical protein
VYAFACGLQGEKAIKDISLIQLASWALENVSYTPSDGVLLLHQLDRGR